MKKALYLLVIPVLALAACKKDDPKDETIPTDYTHGRFVTNEGNFGANNASISWISMDGAITNDVYFTQNGVELGDVLQSMAFFEGKGYAVLNGSEKIEVMTLSDMKNAATIDGFEYPRHVVAASNGNLYVTDGAMAGNVHVINPSTYDITTSIPVGNGPDKLVQSYQYIYVCNSGGWTLDNTVSVIDINTNSVVETITVSDRPSDIAVDGGGDVWVLCSGETIYDEDWNIVGHTDAKLFHIDSDTKTVVDEQQIGVNGDHPQQLAVHGGTVYYENGGVYSFDIMDADFTGTEIITDARGSLDIDPANGELWCTGISDFVNPTPVYRYSATGGLIATYTAGLGANSVTFN